MADKFQALVLEQTNNSTVAALSQISLTDLPEREVLVRVEYSSLNYKDALAVTGQGKVIRQFPIIPGIDLAGEVVDPGQSEFRKGDKVICTGWGVGEQHWGGFSEFAKLDPEWLLPVPGNMDTRAAMIMGTAGLTAAFCSLTISDHGVRPEDGPVLVTGAGGGVGGVSIMILSRLGYEVHAVSGRKQLSDYLMHIGAAGLVPRSELQRDCKPLEKARWSAAVDTVGGQALATLLSQMNNEGIVTACGNAAGVELNTTVFPFILRGVSLHGINSVTAPRKRRQRAWRLLAETLPAEYYDLLLFEEIGLDQVIETSDELLAGKVKGRVIVRPGATQ